MATRETMRARRREGMRPRAAVRRLLSTTKSHFDTMTTLAIFTLAHDQARKRACEAIMKAPAGARVKIDEPKRTLDQNAMLWPILTIIAKSKPHGGDYRTPEEWKGLFMHACGKEVRFLPALDGKGFGPFGMTSSALSKADFSELLEFILAWCAENGIAVERNAA